MVEHKRWTDGRYTNIYGPSIRGCVLGFLAVFAVGVGVVIGLFRLFSGHLVGLRLVIIVSVVVVFVWMLLAIIDETLAPVWRLWTLGLAVSIALGYVTGWLATVIVVATLIILQAVLSCWWAISDRLAGIESKLERRVPESTEEPRPTSG